MSKVLNIAVAGAGPAGLYFAISMKRANPAHRVHVYERNRPDDTFGFGVVFSDATLAGFQRHDRETYDALTHAFDYWDEIEMRYRGEIMRSGGHGFCGIARHTLLSILQGRARELGVELNFETEMADPGKLGWADVIVGADGLNSAVRGSREDAFEPALDIRPMRFTWMGSTQTFDALTYIFTENADGWHYLHTHSMGRSPYGEKGSTWLIECHEDTWRKAGFETMSEAETAAYYAEVYKEALAGHPLLTNHSIWRRFPVVTCDRWHVDNVVLIGDAAHTAQFSVGSGTKLAMEDGMALAAALEAHGGDHAAAFEAFEAERRPVTDRLQHSAYQSLRWYENARRFNALPPKQFFFSFLSRVDVATYENLGVRDPDYRNQVDGWFAELVRTQGHAVPDNDPPPPMFTPLKLRELVIPNRVMVSPMCQYSADDGTVGDWHIAHLGRFATGGAGLVMAEMTDVEPEGRISPACAGMYKPDHVPTWKRVVDFVRAHSQSKIGVQLAHAGRKAGCAVPWVGGGPGVPLGDGEAWPIYGPTAEAFYDNGQVPKEMDRGDMDRIRDAFVRAAGMAEEAGFDLIELHYAHGYLLSSFLSPLTNKRTDDYGGSLENRLRYPLEVLGAVRAAWPAEKPISVRISAVDWGREDGMTMDEAVAVAKALHAAGADIIDVSAGGNMPGDLFSMTPLYQLPFAEQIRLEAGVPTITVGGVTTPDQINTAIASGRADMCALARYHLANPHFTLSAAARYGYTAQPWPRQYERFRTVLEEQAAQQVRREMRLQAAARPPSHKPAERAAE